MAQSPTAQKTTLKVSPRFDSDSRFVAELRAAGFDVEVQG